jgi:hypothetical protein
MRVEKINATDKTAITYNVAIPEPNPLYSGEKEERHSPW